MTSSVESSTVHTRDCVLVLIKIVLLWMTGGHFKILCTWPKGSKVRSKTVKNAKVKDDSSSRYTVISFGVLSILFHVALLELNRCSRKLPSEVWFSALVVLCSSADTAPLNRTTPSPSSHWLCLCLAQNSRVFSSKLKASIMLNFLLINERKWFTTSSEPT